MARRNLVRSLRAALVLAVSAGAGLFVAPATPAGADDPPVKVMVHATEFRPAIAYAKPGQVIVFELADPTDIGHTVTLERADCGDRHPRLCEQRFDDPDDSTVDFRFSEEREYRFFDRYARDAGREMTGKFVITASPQPVPPSSSSTTTTTAPPTTTTSSAPATTTSTMPTTTTTAPASVRPSLVPDPAPTTTTAIAGAAQPAPTGAPSAPAAGKDRNKGKAKSKAGSTQTPTTAAPAPPDSVPPDSIFDAATLTPGPTALPGTPPVPSSGEESVPDAAAVANLLVPAPDAGDRGAGRLLTYGLVALAVLAVAGGLWRWHHRSSRYFPA